MHSTDYQKDANESGGLICTTEQWFRSLQGRKMDCDRVTKPLSNSSDSILLSNDFLKHGWYLIKTYYFGSKIAGEKCETRT